MIIRVIEAIQASAMSRSITICGPARATIDECPALRDLISGGHVAWLPPQDSPCSSTAACMEVMGGSDPVFITTADHGLLNPDIISHFLGQSAAVAADATVGLVDYHTLMQAYPASRRTRLKFHDGSYCGCNLFTLLNDRGRQLVTLWKSVEENRKHPLRILGTLLGPGRTLSYLLGRLTLDNALQSLQEKYQIDARAVRLPYPAAGIDVDTVADLQLVESILSPGAGTAADSRHG